jgi:hypothetical protein
VKKNNEKEKQFMNNISAILPLIVQFITDETDSKEIETTYKVKVKTFGSLKLEAVEMIRIITLKF